MIFAIKRFETHDGDGIRTTVFFKGCPLRCVWCHNPESFSFKKEMAFNPELCVNCLRCTTLCTANQVLNGKHIFKRENCVKCDKCLEVCPSRAFTLYGEERTAKDIATELLRDKMFFDGSGGGVTLSGGEPLAQQELCFELAKVLKENGVNVAIDTCGYVEKSAIERILPYVDTFLYDIKAIDPIIHKKCTGVSNELILENLKFIDSVGKKIEIRIPFVPNFNDGEILKIANFIKGLKNVEKVRVLMYHKYAEMKYISLGITDNSPSELPTKEQLENARKTIKDVTGFEVL